MSITGQISLYSGEVRNNWLNVIKTVPEYDVQLQSLPMWERLVMTPLQSIHPFLTMITFRSLSQSLRGVQIVKDPSHIVLVDNHR